MTDISSILADLEKRSSDEKVRNNFQLEVNFAKEYSKIMKDEASTSLSKKKNGRHHRLNGLPD